MTNIRFYLKLIGSVNADALCTFLCCMLFTRYYSQPQTPNRPSITGRASYVLMSELLKLMFKEISLVFLFKVNRDFSISSVIILILVGKYIKINGNIKEYI